MMRWIAFILLLLVCFWFSGLNLWAAIQAALQRHTGSLIPLVGGLSGFIAMLLSPVVALHKFWFVPLIMDVGSGLLLSKTLLFVAVKLLKKKEHDD